VTAPSLPAAPGSRRPAKPRRSWLLPAGLLAGLLLTIWSAVGIGLEPLSLLQDAGRGLRIIGEVLTPNWAFLPQTIDPLIETFQMAVIASIVGCGIGLPVAFLASRVTSPNRWTLSIDRGVLNIIRALPDLLYAMIFVAALSIGPTAGILALILFNIGVMAKLLSETVDAVDRGPMEAAQAAGASHNQTVRSSVLPQVMPNYVAFSLYIFELNIRASTVLGIVGAGGIGMLLNTQLQYLLWSNIGVIVFEIFMFVLVIELASIWIRRRLV
jgi:phosphonate transport system permease protein